MIGENPVMLIDAAVPDVVGVTDDQEDAPRIVLALDAHQSIPFVFLPDVGLYEAPPRFRATLSHNGAWNSVAGQWTVRPTLFIASLFEGMVKYEFGCDYQDMPTIAFWNGDTSSLHKVPALPLSTDSPKYSRNPWFFENGDPVTQRGLGVPYIAKLHKISDNYGHSVNIRYCEDARITIDKPDTPLCVECAQLCRSKDQIATIELKDGPNVLWTLLYVYRSASNSELWGDLTNEKAPPISWIAPWIDWSLYSSHVKARLESIQAEVAIDRIYVFPGALPESLRNDPPCLRLGKLDDPSWESTVDPIAMHNAAFPQRVIPTDWQYCVRYYYSTHNDGGAVPQVSGRPLLIATNVQQKTSQNQSGDSKWKVYWYDQAPAESGFSDIMDGVSQLSYGQQENATIRPLRAIFEDSDIGRIASAIPVDWKQTGKFGAKQLAIVGVSRDGLGYPESQPFPGWNKEQRRLALGYSNVWVQGAGSIDGEMTSASVAGVWHWTGSPGDSSAPDPALIPLKFVTAVDKRRLVSDGSYRTVGFVSRSDAAGKSSWRIHRLRVFPQDVDVANGNPFHLTSVAGVNGIAAAFIDELNPVRSAFFIPYRWHSYKLSESGPWWQWNQLPFGSTTPEPRWIAIIDEFRDAESARNPSYDPDSGFGPGQLSRRVVNVSATGVVLSERTWDLRDGSPVLSQTGLSKYYEYKSVEKAVDDGDIVFGSPTNVLNLPQSLRSELLLLEVRSLGWSAAHQTSAVVGQNDGLIDVNKYAFFGPTTLPWSSRLRLHSEGLKRGTGGEVSLRKQYFRVDASPSDIDVTVEYLEPRPFSTRLTNKPSVPTGSPGNIDDTVSMQFIVTERDTAASSDPTLQPVRSRKVIGAPRRPRPGVDYYYPLELEIYGSDGNVDWAVKGQVRDPSDLSTVSPTDSDAQLIWTYYSRNTIGQTLAYVVDAAAASPPPEGVTIPAFPNGLHRVGYGAALNYVTKYKYSGDRLSDILFPNGRRWASRIFGAPGSTLEEPITDEYIFNDLVLTSSGQHAGKYTTRTLGEIKRRRGKDPSVPPESVRKVYFRGENLEIELPMGQPPAFTEQQMIAMAYDANGRVQEAALLEPILDENGNILLDPEDRERRRELARKEVAELVDVRRERERDGTITRVTRDLFGRTIRTYRGTDDRGWALGQPESTYNMILLERQEYGSGINDAWLPTVHHTYDTTVPFANDYYGQPPADDTLSQKTVTSYDWRMRPVRVDGYSKGALPGSGASPIWTTLTFLDHADRPILEAKFQATANGALNSVDPVLHPSTGLFRQSDLPLRRSFITLGAISLVETFYGPDGNIYERRNYDVASTGTGEPPYQAERFGYGIDGQQVFSQRPGAPIQMSRIDGVGRVSESITLLPWSAGSNLTDHYVEPYELARTDYKYDGDGNVVETASFERFAYPSGAPTSDDKRLRATGSSTNAVRTRSISWYDEQKKLIATADLGTEQAEYVVGPASYVRPAQWTNLSSVPTANPTTGARTIPSELASKPITIHVYDDKGNRILTSLPSGAATKYTYNLRQEVTQTLENAFGTAAQQRKTGYKRLYGRLIETWLGDDQRPEFPDPESPVTVPDPGQLSAVHYNGDIVEWYQTPAPNSVWKTRVVSRNNSYISHVYLPKPDGSTTKSGTPDYFYRYYFDGSLAERVDRRGVSMRYDYDDHGRIESIEIGYYTSIEADAQGVWTKPAAEDWIAGYPTSISPPSGTPIDRVGFVDFSYDARGNVQNITALTARGAQTPLTDNFYSHNLRGNLLREWQSLGAFYSAANASSIPSIQYAWSYQPTTSDTTPTAIGHNRLTQITYPFHSGLDSGIAGGRIITLNYGTAATSPSAILSRVAEISTNSINAGFAVASFTYTGSGRRMSINYGPIKQSLKLNSTAGLPALDSYGRLKDLLFESTAASNATYFRSESTFDLQGNRISSRITQSSSNGATTVDLWSQLNAYDPLDRLIKTEHGKLMPATGSTGPFSIVNPSASIQKRIDQWNLDLVGNWSAKPTNEVVGSPTVGRYTSDGTGTTGLLQQVDNRNQITALVKAENNSTLTTTPLVYDRAGNLTFDGMYFYQYDAWNRLVQVNKKGALTAASFTAAGVVASGVPATAVGTMVKHHGYDGLGRLVRTASPLEGIPTENGSTAQQTERFYYDGIRRIQEVVVNPVTNMFDEMFAMGTGLSGVQDEILADQRTGGGGEVDGTVASMSYEQAQLSLGESLAQNGGQSHSNIEMPLPSGTTLAREYLWGPGDRGTDEMLAQFDTTGKPWYPIQDGGGDIVALIDPYGGGRVAAQFVYDAYGAVLSAEHFYAHPYLHAGHKGLFIERLDQPNVDTSTMIEIPRNVPLATNYVHMRNRAYAPGLGRFLQRDMNQTGSALNSIEAYHGSGAFPAVAAMDMQGLYGDGLNLYQYLGSNPWLRRDPMGLSYDPFSMVDDYMAEAAGSTAAFLSKIGRDTAAVAVVAATIASYLPFPGAGLVGELALTALGEQEASATALGLAVGLIPGGKLASFVGKIGGSAWSVAKQYATRGGGALTSAAAKYARRAGEALGGLAGRAKDWVLEKKAKVTGCGCFVAGTTVWAATGMVPIEQVQVGDWVFAQDPANGTVELREVTDVMEIKNAGGLDVVLTRGDGTQETISTTDEHPFYVETDACDPTKGEWRRADSLHAGDVVRTLRGTAVIESTLFGTARRSVYNFTVDGLHTYHVGPGGVLVHNCAMMRPGASIPDSKMGFLLGVSKNAEKAAERAGGLARIGLYDSAQTRQYLQEHFKMAYEVTGEVVGKSKSGGPEIESMLSGPGGFTRAVSEWDANGNFITAWFKYPN